MTGPYDPIGWQSHAPRTPLAPPVKRRLHVAVVSTVVIVAGAALVGAVLRTIADNPQSLPAPRVLAHDPVPAERIHWYGPARCGVGDATVRTVLPHATLFNAGATGSCKWFRDSLKSDVGRTLSVYATPEHAGPGTPGTGAGDTPVHGTPQTYSPVAAAMADFASGPPRATDEPVTGLGDEAVLSRQTQGSNARTGIARFRTGNVIVTVDEDAVLEGPAKKKFTSIRTLQSDVLKVAADVARHLGVPAAPKVTKRPAGRPAPVHPPASLCDVVPSDLRKRLVGTDVRSESYDQHPGSEKNCDVSGAARGLNVAVLTSNAPGGAQATARDYLRRYLDARAEPPISRADERYFHALSGLGDEAFCAYLEEGVTTNPGGDESGRVSPARIAARVGAALILVTYGSERADPDQLTREEAVNGAYAVAVRR